jgi:hypothetical protein
MGYTHYFGPTKFSPKQFALVVAASAQVIKIVTEEMKIPLPWELDEPTKVAQCADSTIRFNGLEDDGHETFILSANDRWSFCKTAQKPYDIAVVAILCLAEHYGGAIQSISSDGDADDWAEGLELARRIEPTCELPSTVASGE